MVVEACGYNLLDLEVGAQVRTIVDSLVSTLEKPGTFFGLRAATYLNSLSSVMSCMPCSYASREFSPAPAKCPFMIIDGEEVCCATDGLERRRDVSPLLCELAMMQVWLLPAN